jgi:hypothetical protein
MLGRKKTPANPWTESAVQVLEAEHLEADELMGDLVAIEGPPVPLGLALGSRPRTLRRGFLPASDHLYVVGLHGGSGATTVTRLLGDRAAVDACGVVPQLSVPTKARVLLVARTNGAGLAAAKAAAQEWAAEDLTGTDLIGLVLVADATRLSKYLRAEALSVAGLTPRCWRIGWREDWREQAVPDLSARSARLRKVITDITQRAQTRA